MSRCFCPHCLAARPERVALRVDERRKLERLWRCSFGSGEERNPGDYQDEGGALCGETTSLLGRGLRWFNRISVGRET